LLVFQICHHRVDKTHSPYNYVLPRAKALALFKFLQKGIPIIYNGEEMGIDNNQEEKEGCEILIS